MSEIKWKAFPRADGEDYASDDDAFWISKLDTKEPAPWLLAETRKVDGHWFQDQSWHPTADAAKDRARVIHTYWEAVSQKQLQVQLMYGGTRELTDREAMTYVDAELTAELAKRQIRGEP